METRCQKCGASGSADQAFCSKCGAVVGMSDAGQRHGEGWDLAATVVGQKLPPMSQPTRSPAAAEATHAARTDAAQVQIPQAARGGNTILLVVIGFVAVLLIGGLLILLLYLNSQG
ncbi:MAG: hypothetical protein QOC99_3560 [Acidobacteriota bacterium]|nr:hypothetical protein [Acidobacteriota bacterium]MDT7781048.1 hypothetical protein [Acidobacteriota bacterium]